MVTPLITKIKSEGGTLYTFTSASKDLTRCYTNGTNYQMKFSKFVCLNLPWIMDGNKTLQKYNVDDRYFEYVKSRIEKESGDNTSHLIVDFRVTEKIYNRLNKAEVNFLTTEETLAAIEKLPPYEETDEEGNVEVWHEYSVTFNDELRNEMNVNFTITLYFDDGNPYTSDEFVYHVNTVGNDVEKGLYLEHFPEYKFPTPEESSLTPTAKGETSNRYNQAIAEHFQNYILNFETVLLNRKGFDNSVLRSPAERVFFNWLEKVGGINFQRSTKKGIDQKDLYVENDVLLEDRTVQYIGNIDIINQVDVNGDTFGEIYMYIPSTSGATTEIYFREIQDENYRTDVYKPELVHGMLDTDVIQGRENFRNSNITPLKVEAIYDGSHPNNYTVDKGFCVDFRDADYEYNSIEQVNANSFTNFEFNTVLIYYDLYDTSTNEEKFATNLYGVLFIDNFIEDNDRVNILNENHLAHIHQYPKFKSSEFSDGNAFALKLDLKIDTAPTTTMSAGMSDLEVYENPNEVEDMIMFAEALTQLQKCADTFFTQQNEIYRLQDRVESLESITTSIDDISTVKVALTALENRFNENGVIGSENVMNMIMNCYDMLSDILNNKYPTKLALDLNKLKLGNGLRYKSNSDGSTTLYNTQQAYNVIGKISFNQDDIGNPNLITPVEDTIRFELRENTNLAMLSSVESQYSDKTMWDSISIIIDAYDRVQWQKGQTVKFVVTDDFKFGYVKHNSISIQTQIDPVENDTHDDVRTITIKKFGKDDLSKMKNKTEIEIVCIDDDFTTDGDKFIIMTR